MSMFQHPDYQWRETCFVYFHRDHRPQLKQVIKALEALDAGLELSNPQADERGYFESLTVVAPGNHAAMDVAYICGSEIREEAAKLVNELSRADLQPDERTELQRILDCDGRFDILHFEQIANDDDGDDGPGDELFDPSALILVLGELSRLTKGVAVDPQSGVVL